MRLADEAPGAWGPKVAPKYLLELLMAARHFARSPDLYASIPMSNLRTEAVTRAFVEAASGLKAVVDAKVTCLHFLSHPE